MGTVVILSLPILVTLSKLTLLKNKIIWNSWTIDLVLRKI